MTLNKELPYKAIFAATVLFYCLFLARNGYEEWDSGFISGLAWRIINGERMYTDFIYTKPPVTPFLAALYMKLLPEEGQFYFIRCINYLTFALQTLLTVFAVNAVYPLKKLGVNPWGVATVGFAVSYLNISPYPWYTEDGLLFAAAALFLKAYPQKKLWLHLPFIALLALISALCKQSFYPVPLVFGAWILLEDGAKRFLVYTICLLLWGGIFLFVVSQLTSLPNFFTMISGQAHLHDLYYSAVYGYLHKNWQIYAIIAVLTVIVFVAGWYRQRLKAPRLLVWFIWLQLITGLVLLFTGKGTLGSIIAFNGSGCAILYSLFIRKKKLRTLLLPIALLCIAWCASVSWGYAFPIFCSTGIILVFIVLMGGPVARQIRQLYTPIGIAVFLAGLSYNWFPYRQQSVPALTGDMGLVSPRLKYIRADKATFTRFMELKKLVAHYGQPYIVTTNYSGSHYLFGTKNPLRADWMINSEYSFRLKEMVETAARSGAHIFVEHNYNPTFDRQSLRNKQYSYFSQYVKDHCTPIEKLPTFTVYHSRDLYEALPETAAP